MLRQTLHDKTLHLATLRVHEPGAVRDMAAIAGVTYQGMWRWLFTQDKKTTRLNVDAVQRLYEHLTGKQLEY